MITKYQIEAGALDSLVINIDERSEYEVVWDVRYGGFSQRNGRIERSANVADATYPAHLAALDAADEFIGKLRAGAEEAEKGVQGLRERLG